MSQSVPSAQPDEPGTPGGLTVPEPVMTARLGATVLLMEALLAFFATLAAFGLAGPEATGRGWLWAAGLGLTVLFVLGAGVVRRPWGVAAGTALQGVLVATGFAVPAMFGVGLAFAGLWWWLVSIGRRIDADRRRWARQLAEEPPGTSSGGAPA